MNFSFAVLLQSGSEKTSSNSRLSSNSSAASEHSPAKDVQSNGTENIDYKALYEAAR